MHLILDSSKVVVDCSNYYGASKQITDRMFSNLFGHVKEVSQSPFFDSVAKDRSGTVYSQVRYRGRPLY